MTRAPAACLHQGCDIDVELTELSIAVTRVHAVVHVFSPQNPSLGESVLMKGGILAANVADASNTLKLMLFTCDGPTATNMQSVTVGSTQTPVGHTAMGSSLSTGAARFAHTLHLQGFSPTDGSFGGGTELTLTGGGFPRNALKAQVWLGDKATCEVKSSSFNQIVCVTNPPELGAFSPSMPPPPRSPPPNAPQLSLPPASPVVTAETTSTIALGTGPAAAGSYPSEVSFTLVCDDSVPKQVASGASGYLDTDFETPSGVCTLTLRDSYGDGWNKAELYAPALAAVGESNMQLLGGVLLENDRFTLTTTGDGEIGKVILTIPVPSPPIDVPPASPSSPPLLPPDYPTPPSSPPAPKAAPPPPFTVNAIIELIVDDVLATGVRNGTGSFGFLMSSTPFISSIATTRLDDGSYNVTVYGTGFGVSPSDNVVKVASFPCIVSEVAADGTELTCVTGAISAGNHPVTLHLSGVGLALYTGEVQTIWVPLELDGTPVTTATGGVLVPVSGGTHVHVHGSGFGQGLLTNKVTLCDEPCDVISATVEEIVCVAPALVPLTPGGQTSVTLEAVPDDADNDDTSSIEAGGDPFAMRFAAVPLARGTAIKRATLVLATAGGHSPLVASVKLQYQCDGMDEVEEIVGEVSYEPSGFADSAATGVRERLPDISSLFAQVLGKGSYSESQCSVTVVLQGVEGRGTRQFYTASSAVPSENVRPRVDTA